MELHHVRGSASPKVVVEMCQGRPRGCMHTLNLRQAYTAYSARFNHVMSKQYVKRVIGSRERPTVDG